MKCVLDGRAEKLSQPEDVQRGLLQSPRILPPRPRQSKGPSLSSGSADSGERAPRAAAETGAGTPAGRRIARTLTGCERRERCGLHHQGGASPGGRDPWSMRTHLEFTRPAGTGGWPAWLVETGPQVVDEKHPDSAVAVGAQGCPCWRPQLPQDPAGPPHSRAQGRLAHL